MKGLKSLSSGLKRAAKAVKLPKTKPEKRSLLQVLKREITPIRKTGERPKRDMLTFNKHFCDTCGVSFETSEMSQCNACGRWVCHKACLSDRYGLCKSCSDVLQMIMDSKEGQ